MTQCSHTRVRVSPHPNYCHHLTELTEVSDLGGVRHWYRSLFVRRRSCQGLLCCGPRASLWKPLPLPPKVGNARLGSEATIEPVQTVTKTGPFTVCFTTLICGFFANETSHALGLDPPATPRPFPDFPWQRRSRQPSDFGRRRPAGIVCAVCPLQRLLLVLGGKR